MSVKIAGAIYQKEMLEILRDRRTLISMVVVPLFAMPILFGVMGKFIQSRAKEAQGEAVTVGVASEAEIGPSAALVVKAAGFQLVTKRDLRAAVENKDVAAALERSTASGGEAVYRVYVDKTRQASAIAGEKLRAALDGFKDSTIRASLRGSGVPETILTPFSIDSVNVASEKKMGGFVLGSSLGYIVILLMFTGALYPAIDTAAGEKERRTLEALLCSPAPRNDIVLGKVLACATASFLTAVLAMASMVYSYRNTAFAALLGPSTRFDLLDPRTFSLVLLSVLPVAILAASLMVAISFFAKSYKEGQSYLTPLLMVVVFPAVLGMLPGMELTPKLALIPIFNVCQIVKEIFLGSFSMSAFVIACSANLVYAGLAFFAATRIFRAEGVLFRV